MASDRYYETGRQLRTPGHDWNSIHKEMAACVLLRDCQIDSRCVDRTLYRRSRCDDAWWCLPHLYGACLSHSWCIRWLQHGHQKRQDGQPNERGRQLRRRYSSCIRPLLIGSGKMGLSADGEIMACVEKARLVHRLQHLAA